MTKDIKLTIGSGNVFKDLGFKNPEDEQVKAELARQINFLIKKKHWTQTEASEKLKLTQPKISNLNRGQLKNFSLEKLMHILNNLNQDIEIIVRPHASKRHAGDIHVSFL